MRRAFLLGLLIVGLASHADEQGILITRGFLNGQTYIEASEMARSYYVMGLVDGLLVSPMMDARVEKNVINFSRCLTGITSDKLDALLLAEFEENPRTLEQSVHITLFNVLSTLCEKSSAESNPK